MLRDRSTSRKDTSPYSAIRQLVGFFGAHQIAQYRVDKAGAFIQPQLFAQLYALIDSCAVGHLIHKDQLINAEVQDRSASFVRSS